MIVCVRQSVWVFQMQTSVRLGPLLLPRFFSHKFLNKITDKIESNRNETQAHAHSLEKKIHTHARTHILSQKNRLRSICIRCIDMNKQNFAPIPKKHRILCANFRFCKHFTVSPFCATRKREKKTN